jgi:glyoxylase-like metal-dependent hydrolase (beta-lactamase superfamily II)
MTADNWRPVVIRVGATYPDMSGLVQGLTPGCEQEAPILCLALERGATRVLVDTGLPELEWVQSAFGKVTRTPDEQLVEALRRFVGWQPSDVDYVINTHLHFDHCGGNRLLPNARFVVQRTEYEFALSPTLGMGPLYPAHLFDRSAVDYFDWLFVDGDHELFRGLRLLFTPGHSPGHQSVVFQATDGVVVFAGDAIGRMESIERRLAPGLYTDLASALHSVERIRDVADRVIPSHDTRVPAGQRDGFFPVPA